MKVIFISLLVAHLHLTLISCVTNKDGTARGNLRRTAEQLEDSILEPLKPADPVNATDEDEQQLIWIENNNTFMNEYWNDSKWQRYEPPLSGPNHDYWIGGHLYREDYWHVKLHPWESYEREPWGYIKNQLASNSTINSTEEVDEQIDRQRIWSHCDDEEQPEIYDDMTEEGVIVKDSDVKVMNAPHVNPQDARVQVGDHEAVYVEGETPISNHYEPHWENPKGRPIREEKLTSKVITERPENDQPPEFENVKSSEPAAGEVTEDEIDVAGPKSTELIKDEPGTIGADGTETINVSK